MRRPGHIAEIAISAAMVASTGLFAQTSDRPTVTVLAFETPSRMDGGALADELATALIDTNHVRVLPRQWLQIAKSDARSLKAHRSSAAAAGVQFLVACKVARVYPRGVAAGPRGPSMLALVLDARIIGTESGDVVRTRSIRIDAPPVNITPLPQAGGLPTLTMVSVVKPRAPMTWEAEAVKHAVASLAKTLDFSAVDK